MQAEHTAEQALTHHVALVLDNDESLYNWRRELVAMAQRGAAAYLADPDNAGSPLTVERIAVADLADTLKDWCEDLAGLESDSMPMFQRELLTTALAFVDWREGGRVAGRSKAPAAVGAFPRSLRAKN